MKHHLLVAIPALTLALVCAAAVQESVKVDFKSSADKAQKAYDVKAWGECTRQLRNALQAVQKLRSDALRAALPAAPSGMKAEDDQSNDGGLFMAGIGSQVSRNYTADDGERSVRLTVHADFAMIGAMLPTLTNPMIVQASGGELLAYGTQKAVLTKQGEDGKSWKLQIVIDSTHLIEADAQGVTRDALLKMFDGAAVAKIAKELSN